MGKPTGFMLWPREGAPRRAVGERLGDWKELGLLQAPERAREQAGRCMDCGVPFCHQGCPLGNQIPDWNDLVYRDRWEAAFRSLSETNNFPEFTGRLCPAPCEAACVLAINQDPVTIEHIEQEIAEHAFAHGWVQPRPPPRRSGKRVGVVGSGPAGLAAAAQLNQAGHQVTVYERADRPGGLLRYGIPDFKLEKQVVDRRLAVLEREGVEFRTGVDVGGALGWAELRAGHDALVLAIGALRPRELAVPGRELRGVHLAMTYLEQQNRVVSGLPVADAHIDARGKRVVILGGGDTGSDCLGTALRQGAAHVTQIELLPSPPGVRAPENPWPQWPLVLRTSSSQEEGGAREFAVMTKRLVGEAGQLVALEAVHVKAGVVDGRWVLEEQGETFRIPCDLLVLALGFTGPDTGALVAELGVTLDARGAVATRGPFATHAPGVFVAGDAMRGASLVVWAIADGRECARAVDSFLRGAPSTLPTKGADRPFGGR
jgi:glutamate synthase (NADPH/NADH) small chain